MGAERLASENNDAWDNYSRWGLGLAVSCCTCLYTPIRNTPYILPNTYLFIKFFFKFAKYVLIGLFNFKGLKVVLYKLKGN